jgi:hypothetical protein
MKKGTVLLLGPVLMSVLLWLPSNTWGQGEIYLGNLSVNPYASDSTSNPYSSFGSKYGAKSINNPYSQYGSPYSNKSVSNPYATQAPKLYDSQGNYKGKLSNNPYDPDSVSNPFGRYGSKYSSDSINNPYGAGSPYKSDSPSNPYGTGLKIFGSDTYGGYTRNGTYVQPYRQYKAIIFFGGGIDLNPREFKQTVVDRNSPKLSEIVRIKDQLKPFGDVVKSGDWIRSNSGVGGARINKLPLSVDLQ